ncbi:alpha/beta hydrolase [Streptomyces caelestis]|uniref:alpha/beta hydrolase n=1 Tax=Streptomyces caelestis TaxID=36816 RepID=UPI0036FC99BF
MEASTCAYWHHRPARRTLLDGPDAPPVLLVASASAPVALIAGARRLSRLLPGTRLITLDNDYSHGVLRQSRQRLRVGDAAAAFLFNGR